MNTVEFQYKCKLCGKINDSLGTGEQYALLQTTQLILHGTTKTSGFPLTLLDLHNCKDGNTGISELIGYKIVRIKK